MVYGTDRFKNSLKKGNIVTFASPGAAKSSLGRKFKITDIIGEDLELIDTISKRRTLTSAHNVVKIR